MFYVHVFKMAAESLKTFLHSPSQLCKQCQLRFLFSCNETVGVYLSEQNENAMNLIKYIGNINNRSKNSWFTFVMFLRNFDLCASKDSLLICDLANIFSISSGKSPVQYSITFPVILLFKSRLIFLQQTLKCNN